MVCQMKYETVDCIERTQFGLLSNMHMCFCHSDNRFDCFRANWKLSPHFSIRLFRQSNESRNGEGDASGEGQDSADQSGDGEENDGQEDAG